MALSLSLSSSRNSSFSPSSTVFRFLPQPTLRLSFYATTLRLLLGLRTRRFHPTASTLNVNVPLLFCTRPSLRCPLPPSATAFGFLSRGRTNSLFSGRSRRAKGRIAPANNVFLFYHVARKLGITETGEEHQLQYSQRANNVKFSEYFEPVYGPARRRQLIILR